MYNEKIFKAFSRIPLKIDENLGFHGLELSEEDRVIMGDKDYFEYMNIINERKNNLYFKNVFIDFDVSDYDDSTYPYQILVKNETDTIIDIEEDSLIFNTSPHGVLPIKNSSICDFIRMCNLCGIRLEYSERGLNLINKI